MPQRSFGNNNFWRNCSYLINPRLQTWCASESLAQVAYKKGTIPQEILQLRLYSSSLDMSAANQDVIMLLGDSITQGGWVAGGFAQELACQSQPFEL